MSHYYLTELQRQNIENAIRINLIFRGKRICPKIVPSLQNKENSYDILFWGNDRGTYPIVQFNINVLTKMPIQLLAEHAINRCFRIVNDLVDYYPNELRELKKIPMDREYVSTHLFLEAVNTERNTELLRFVPHYNNLDLSFICRLEFSELVINGGKERRSVIVDDSLLDYMELQHLELQRHFTK